MEIKKQEKTSKILKWVLALAIVIVLNLFFTYSIKLIYHTPTYDNFCPRQQVTEEIKTKEACLDKGGAWTEDSYYGKPVPTDRPEPIMISPSKESAQTGYCDQNFTCSKNLEQATKLYNRNFFIVLVILGMLSIALSIFLRSIWVVSIGLALGGVISLIIGSARYWSDMNDYLRVIILALALISLIWLGVKKFKE